ncbi:TVP38/TMEM64 family protein [Pseudalkalibacillus sp. R45]|uniref:TVP38/TMEM64 family protein n=1 Tax=Pseudalkalibacillus sp. R45 TaxID=3457433 RepID=UPI003FCDAF79
MGDTIISLFRDYPHLAVLISVTLNILIAISGFLPSYFLTAANLYFFGFFWGTAISFAGEAAGALLAFLLYRKGFRKFTRTKLERYSKAKRLIELEGKKAFLFIFGLRLMPFMPSGVVTFFSAIGIVSIWTFFAASTLGKFPALLLEALAVTQVLEWNMLGKMILMGVSIAFLLSLRTMMKKQN